MEFFEDHFSKLCVSLSVKTGGKFCQGHCFFVKQILATRGCSGVAGAQFCNQLKVNVSKNKYSVQRLLF